MITGVIDKIIVFIIIIIVSASVMSVFVLLGKESSGINSYNYDPLPTQHPSDIPDSGMHGETPVCFRKPTKCLADGTCPCGDNTNTMCSNPEDKITRIMANGVAIPHDGNSYCVPRGDTEDVPCNPYTGQYVWVDNQGVQQWECKCKYPDLFDDPSTGCTNPTACQNISEISQNAGLSNQNGNKLAYAPSLITDPTRKNEMIPVVLWDPQTNTDDGFLLENRPYDTFTQNDITELDKKPHLSGKFKPGDPKFVCSCGIDLKNNTVKKHTTPYYVRLPNDPYNCHIDPCFSLDGYDQSGLENSTGEATGYSSGKGCNCEATGGSKIKLGSAKGLCHHMEKQCNEVPLFESNGVPKPSYFDASAGSCSGDDTNTTANMCTSDFVSIENIAELVEKNTTGFKYNINTCSPSQPGDCKSGICKPIDTSKFTTAIRDKFKDDIDWEKGGVCGCYNKENPIGTEVDSICFPNPCKNNTMCNITPGGYTCDCNKTTKNEDKFVGTGGPPSLDSVTEDTSTHKGLFKMDTMLDCNIDYTDKNWKRDNNNVWGYWGNLKKDSGKCTDIMAIPGTPVMYDKQKCIFSIKTSTKAAKTVEGVAVGLAVAPILAVGTPLGAMVAYGGATAGLSTAAINGFPTSDICQIEWDDTNTEWNTGWKEWWRLGNAQGDWHDLNLKANDKGVVCEFGSKKTEGSCSGDEAHTNWLGFGTTYDKTQCCNEFDSGCTTWFD